MLDQKAQNVLEYINERINEGVPPSVREICADLGIKSTSTVHKYLKQLEQEGYIERDQNLNRSIKMPGASTTKVPLLGTVTAGLPILAVEQIEEYIPYKARYGSDKDLFALRVRGDSMMNAGILDGDIIVSRKVSVAENGQIVVAMVEDEATVKRFYKEKGHFRLQPENDAFDPIIVEDVRILGRVVSVMRFYE
ncbi:transcriptional repressor LexA [Hydrogenoanaerobacterium sp.]|uniref:transcriptional repressor LexA n=1 Tax=Hydrogenoanaerobacterium sp. TaxID=2953763 RepID=UPI00289D6089|nr:transcriptional repressor LexA [Hydrogenoanaerobacterium sp.]